MTPLQHLSQVSNEKITVLKFWAPWCGPCKTMGPVYDKVAELNPDVDFFSVDMDSELGETLAQKFGIRAIPSGVMLHGTKDLYRINGVQSVGQVNTVIQQFVNEM